MLHLILVDSRGVHKELKYPYVHSRGWILYKMVDIQS